jgi:hypothetical protein
MVNSHLTRRTCAISLSRLLVRMGKSGSLLFILLLIPGLSCPSIIINDQSRATVTSEAFTDGVGASRAIDATALYVFPNAGSEVAADTRIPGEKQPDENQLSLPLKAANHPSHHETSSFYLLVFVIIFALFIELTGNRFR